MGSPGFQPKAVMLSYVEPSEAALVTYIYRDIEHTRGHISIEGSVAGQGGVAYTAAHSSPTG